MPNLLDASDVDQQQGGIAPGLLNEGSPVSNDRGPLSVLFPSGPYGNMPGLNLKALRKSQLLELGARLVAGSGPKPQGTSSPLSDIGSAVGGTMQEWQQRLPQAANSAMQLTQFQYQMQGRQALMKAMQKIGPMPQGGSPASRTAWYSQMAGAMAEAGSAGLPLAMNFANLAKTNNESTSDLHYVDGVLTPQDVQANPNLGKVGDYGAKGLDPKTGATTVFEPKPRLTPDQTEIAKREIRKAFTEEINPGNQRALAYKSFQNIDPNDHEKGTDLLRAKLVGQMLGEGNAIPGMDPAQAKTLQGMITEMLVGAGQLSPGTRARYEKAVRTAAEYWKSHNSTILNHYQHAAPEGVDTSDYSDEWQGIELGGAAPKAPKAGFDPSKAVSYPK